MASTAGDDASIENDLEGAAPSESAGPDRPAGPTLDKNMTPGQRLAARKQAKAQRKAELKGAAVSAPEELAGEVEKAAVEFTDFWSHNQQRILLGIGLFLAAAVGVLLWSRQAKSGAAEEAQALYEAIELRQARIVDPEDLEEAAKGEEPVFSSVEDRAKQALKSYQSLQKQHPGSYAAAWGLLGEGVSHLELGDAKKAASAFATAAKQAGDDEALLARAVEGEALAAEAAEDFDKALAKFEELGKLDEQRYRDLAEFGMARIKLLQGDREAAKKLLKAVYDKLLAAPAAGDPPQRYLKSQVEQYLTELDSSLVDTAPPTPLPGTLGGLGGLGGDDMSPEQLQELLNSLQQKQKAGSP